MAARGRRYSSDSDFRLAVVGDLHAHWDQPATPTIRWTPADSR